MGTTVALQKFWAADGKENVMITMRKWYAERSFESVSVVQPLETFLALVDTLKASETKELYET